MPVKLFCSYFDEAKLTFADKVEKGLALGSLLWFHNSLKLSSPYINHWHQDKEDGGDIPVDDPEILRPYGIQNLEENFAVEALSGSKMILRSKELKLYFTNF